VMTATGQERVRPTLRRCALLVPLVAGFASTAGAQDANYWTFQYGPVAQLLGGQVVASSRDLSATYYNPGALGLSEDPTFLLSTYAFTLESVSVDAGPAVDIYQLSSRRFGPSPSLIAVAFPRRWLGQDTRLAFSYLTRQNFDLRLQERTLGELPDPAGRFGAETLLDQRMNEGWAGLTLSRRMGDSWSLGLTWYGVFRSQRTRREASIQASDGVAGFDALTISDFNYFHTRTLAKVGAAWEGRRWQLGLAVTTPSLGVFGSGDAGYTVSAQGADLDGDGTIDSVLRNNLVKDTPAEFHSSWAVAAGVTWRDDRRSVNVNAEWFAPVDEFSIMDVEGAGIPGVFEQGYSQELKSVLNVGVGYSHRFSSGVELYGAAHTDFSAAPDSRSGNVATSTWNLYHVTAGTSFTVSGSRFTLGLSYAVGSNRTALGGNLPPGTPILGEPIDPDVRYSRLSLVVGFLFGSGQ